MGREKIEPAESLLERYYHTGDEGVLGRLLALLEPGICRFLKRCLEPKDDVEDVWGDVRAALIVSFRRSCPVRSFLSRITLRKADAVQIGIRDVTKPSRLLVLLREGPDPLSTYLRERLPVDARKSLTTYDGSALPTRNLVEALGDCLNSACSVSLHEKKLFDHIKLSEYAQWLRAAVVHGESPAVLNRLLLHEAYPDCIRTPLIRNPAAFAFLWVNRVLEDRQAKRPGYRESRNLWLAIRLLLQGDKPGNPFARWSVDGPPGQKPIEYCGLKSQKGTQLRLTPHYLSFAQDPGQFHREVLRGKDPGEYSRTPADTLLRLLIDLLMDLFEWLGTPLELKELKNHLRRLSVLPKLDTVLELDAPSGNSGPTMAEQLRAPTGVMEYIYYTGRREELWSEILSLPQRQRIALVLKMERDALLLLTGTRIPALADPFEISGEDVVALARLLEVPGEDVGRLVSMVPLPDKEIGAFLELLEEGKTFPSIKVSNLRDVARRRLTRRFPEFMEPSGASSLFLAKDIKNPEGFAIKLRDRRDSLYDCIHRQLTTDAQNALARYDGSTPLSMVVKQAIIEALNRVLHRGCPDDARGLVHVEPSDGSYEKPDRDDEVEERIYLYRHLLEEACPDDL